MKSHRIPHLSYFEANEVTAANFRSSSQDNDTRIEEVLKIENISKKISERCLKDQGVALRLRDEFSKELIVSVISECRGMISETSMTSEHWNGIREFLSKDLAKFSRLKEELEFSKRKCVLIQQKTREIMKLGARDEMKNRLMACAMLLAETEMRRDHLCERVSMIVDEFVTRILSDLAGSPSYIGLELRLRAVFGKL